MNAYRQLLKHSLYLTKQAAAIDDEISLSAQDILEQISQVWIPYEGQQTAFMECNLFEVFVGGAAGGGKTDMLVVKALEQIWHPRYNGIIFRRTLEDLEKADGPIERSKLYYPQMGGVYNSTKRYWQFPSGARVYFGGLQFRDDVLKYQSTQFQYIAFDELTHFEEFQYLYMFSRLREPYDNSGLILLMRSGSNPGGMGHFWVKNRFVVQDIENNPAHFARIDDIDKRVDKNHPHARARRFFKATIDDNPAIGKNYASTLEQLPEIEYRRLRWGDWDAEYKDVIWQNFTSKNISSEAVYHPDYPVYWSVDDGTRNPRVILLIQERPLLGIMDAIVVFYEYRKTEELAANAIDNVLELPYPEPDLIVHDPSAAAFQAECWITYGFMTQAGDNDVAEGIKTVRRLLGDNEQNRSLFIHPDCKGLISEMSQYRYDDKSKITKGGDPKPIKENDHACFTGDTMVLTDEGEKPISQIEIGDMVLTRDGFRPVINCGITGYSDRMATVTLSNGTSVTCTPEHPIWVIGRGFVNADALRYNSHIVPLEQRLLACQSQKPLHLMALNIAATLLLSVVVIVFTIVHQTAGVISIGLFGNFIMEIFLMATIFTTKTAILSTTTLAILNLCLSMSIYHCIAVPQMQKLKQGNLSLRQLPLHPLGTLLKRVLNGIVNTAKRYFQTDRIMRVIAKYVVLSIKPKYLINHGFVPINASLPIGGKAALTTKQDAVLYVACPSIVDGTLINQPVHANVEHVRLGKVDNPIPVYNLTVDHAVGEFYANGILVKNCDSLRYYCHTMAKYKALGE